MRICDKCKSNVIYTEIEIKRSLETVDLCHGCYKIFEAWAFNGDRTRENDPIEPTKEVSNARRNKR